MTGPIVVVGGGLAAGTLVSSLREGGYADPVTVICGEDHPPYERPPLSKSFLRGETPAQDTYLNPRSWYEEHDVTLLTGTEVTAVDLAGHSVSTSSGEHGYDRLVLATGCRARRLPLDPTPDVSVHHLRSLEDSAALKAVLVPDVRLLVVGGGWIGLEVAASARTIGASVTLVEPAAEPLAGTLGTEVGAWFADLHRAHGVDLRTGTGLRALDGRRADLDDGTSLEVDVVVVGIGAVPRDSLARDAGLTVDNGILVNESLVTSDPDVLAIGDVARHFHPVLRHRVRVEHWQNAQSQGKVAAQVLVGADVTYDELPSFFSDQYDAGLEYWGHLGAEPARVELDRAGDGFVARWYQDGQLVAAGHVNQWDDAKALAAEVAAAH